jgi:hypothetical protein
MPERLAAKKKREREKGREGDREKGGRLNAQR